jgi:hypothetical protein
MEEDKSTPKNMLAIISNAASDATIDVAKMERLLNVQERMMEKQAEINFNQSLNALQSKLPVISKSGKIIHSGKVISSYAKYEDIHKAINPVLIENGFSLRYNSRESDGKMVITGTLAHIDGHSITDEIPLSIDSSGAKNSVQGVGSTISYGKRYLVSMLLNLVFEGEDDDGNSAGHVQISAKHAKEIKELIEETGSDTKKFLKWLNAKSVDEMSEKDYPRALAALERKVKVVNNDIS